MQKKIRRHPFTLMETMIAATILATAVAATMGIVAGARSTLLRAETRWARQHLLAQAAEFYLLGGPTAQMPESLLPDGCTATCEVYAVEDIEEEALETIRGWCLAEFHISVLDSGGNLMGETRVRKVLKEDDLE